MEVLFQKMNLSEFMSALTVGSHVIETTMLPGMNILIAGMEPPVEPIESKPLHHISVMQVLARKWEAAPFRAR